MRRLTTALYDVHRELEASGFWTDKLADVEVYLTWYGYAYGWQYYRSSGHIEIPAISLIRLHEVFYRTSRFPLRDLLRHEYAHALADTNRGLMKSKQFRRAFGSGHDSEIASDFCPTEHVSEYASTDACEDFAEVFRVYLKHTGRLPKRFQTDVIFRKWTFVKKLREQIEGGNRVWQKEEIIS